MKPQDPSVGSYPWRLHVCRNIRYMESIRLWRLSVTLLLLALSCSEKTPTHVGSADAALNGVGSRPSQVQDLEHDGIQHIQPTVVRVSSECFRPHIALGLDDPMVDRFVPVFENGRTIGMKALIRTDGVLAGIGMLPGDVLTSIEGIPLTSAKDVSKAVRCLRAEPSEIQIRIKRADVARELHIFIDRSASRCRFFHTAGGL